MVGGFGDNGGGEMLTLQEQLKLISSIGNMTDSFFLGGQISLTVLRCVLGLEVGNVPNCDLAEIAVGQLIVSMLSEGINIRVPIDLVCENDPDTHTQMEGEDPSVGDGEPVDPALEAQGIKDFFDVQEK